MFRRRLSGFDFEPVIGRFDDGLSRRHLGPHPGVGVPGAVRDAPGLGKLLGRLGVEEESPGVAASALEFALEGLHLSRRLNKDAVGRLGAVRYGA